MAAAKKGRSPVKATVKKRSLNAGPARGSAGEPFSNQDAKRRLGTFEGAGEHARVGGRTSGIVGQTTKRFSTQKKKKT
jgi:hypothetical protein